MAGSSSSNTKKKTSSGKSTSRPKSGAASSKKKTTKSYSSDKGKRPVRREVGSVICFFLCVFSVLGLFGVKALFIDFFNMLTGGIIGYGCYLLPFSLIAACGILALHKGRPVVLRVCAVIGLSFLFGAVLHLFIDKNTYPGGFETVKELFKLGQQYKCGGVFGGMAAAGFEYVFSGIGAAIILIAGMIILVFVAFSLSPVAIFNYLFRRERPVYEVVESEPEQDRAESAARSVRQKPDKMKPGRRNGIDVPPPDEPVEDLDSGRNGAGHHQPEQKAPLLPKRPEHIRTPDEILTASAAPPSGAEQSAKAEDYTINVLSMNEKVEKPAVPSMKPSVPQPEEKPKQELPSSEEKSPARETFSPEPADDVVVTVTDGEQSGLDEKIKREVAGSLAISAGGQEPSKYVYPPLNLLDETQRVNVSGVEDELRTNATRLTETIKSFGIEARIINVTRGPSVTRYELEMDRGIKLTKLTGLSDDIALSLGASSVRIAPIPDKVAVVGIEVPNKIVSTVYMRELIEDKEFVSSKSRVSFAIGKDISGEAVVGDIARLPHMLIAGTTGSGKSVCMNSLIISLLYKASPDEVRLIMIDPKMIELNIYNGIPHLLIPVVTDPKKASGALQWAVSEMMRRYKQFAETNVRDIFAYNELAAVDEDIEKMPQIVIVIDELADLMLVAAKEVEESICRIAQMARAAGMHLIIATQRPSADVITGIMKANIPSRIAFAVASQLESRIILDTTGAEKLVGKGDMLFYPLGSGKPRRVQGCFITSAEVEKVVEFVKKRGETDYSSEVLEHIEKAAQGDKGGTDSGNESSDMDEMLPQAVEVILETGQASVSMLQRRLKLGYARAARLVDQMESRGIVGPFEGAKPRQLLITRDQWEEMKLQNPGYQ